MGKGKGEQGPICRNPQLHASLPSSSHRTMAEHHAGDNKPLPLSDPDTDSARSTPTTFFPENALQLQLDVDENGHDGDDEHDNEREHESERRREPSPHPEPQQQERQRHEQQQQQQQQPPSSSFAHVRFHSRVRITSGMRRHSRGTRSLDSSDSDSPSSSISAPLRYRSHDANPRGPLGQRISRLAAQALQKRRAAAAAAITPSAARGDEHAPLRPAGFPVVTYGATRDRGPGNDADSERRSQIDLRGEEIAFGRWPWRALNRHVSGRSLLPTRRFVCLRWPGKVVAVADRIDVMLLLF